MQRHVGPVSKRFMAHRARERLLARVYTQMLLEQHLPGERLATVMATVWLFARVYTHVHVVRYPLIETLAAVFTLVLFPVPVNFHVRAKVTAVIEQLTTFWATTRKLSSTLMH